MNSSSRLPWPPFLLLLGLASGANAAPPVVAIAGPVTAQLTATSTAVNGGWGLRIEVRVANADGGPVHLLGTSHPLCLTTEERDPTGAFVSGSGDGSSSMSLATVPPGAETVLRRHWPAEPPFESGLTSGATLTVDISLCGVELSQEYLGRLSIGSVELTVDSTDHPHVDVRTSAQRWVQQTIRVPLMKAWVRSVGPEGDARHMEARAETLRSGDLGPARLLWSAEPPDCSAAHAATIASKGTHVWPSTRFTLPTASDQLTLYDCDIAPPTALATWTVAPSGQLGVGVDP